MTTCVYHVAAPALTSAALVQKLKSALLSAEGARESKSAWIATCTEYAYNAPRPPRNPSDEYRRQVKKQRKLDAGSRAAAPSSASVPSSSRLYRFKSSRYPDASCYLRTRRFSLAPWPSPTLLNANRLGGSPFHELVDTESK